jgi:hypothetical protein
VHHNKANHAECPLEVGEFQFQITGYMYSLAAGSVVLNKDEYFSEATQEGERMGMCMSN